MTSQASFKARRQVALVYPLAVPWMTEFVRGVIDFGERHGGWSLTTSPPSLMGAGEETLTLDGLQGWPGHGAIAAILNDADIDSARRLGIPVVNLAATLREPEVPSVWPDHYGMGRMAAEHLLERGLRRLAYFGLEGFWFSELRGRGFADRAEEAGCTCDVLQVPRRLGPGANWYKRTELMIRWLRQLSPPVGLLAVQDYRARAVMLNRLMEGQSSMGDVVVPSEGVTARQSTDTIAVEDPHLAAALHFIHDHLSEPFGIDQIVRATSISRRQLEIRFRRILGCTPHEYLNGKRIDRVKQLLSAPGKVKLHSVMTACGFSSVKRLRLARNQAITEQSFVVF